MPRDKDKRIKLTDEQRQDIRELKGHMSQRKIAALFGVSRRLVTFIHDPDKLTENLLRRAERGGTMIYYDKEYHRKAILKHRLYKIKVMQELETNNQNQRTT